MELVLARHAQPDWYPGGKFLTNPPLTELGHQQSELLGRQLEGEHFDHILVSPLLRARQTVAPLLKRLGRDEVVADWLEEIREPQWDGMAREEVAKCYEAEDELSIDERWRGVEGGEHIGDFSKRIEAGLVDFLGSYGIVHHDHEVPTWTYSDDTPEGQRAIAPRNPWGGANGIGPGQTGGPRILMVAHGGTNGVISTRLLGALPSPWPWFRVGYQHTTVGRFHARPTNGVLSFMMTGLETHHLPPEMRTA
jgi:2,3-bisphosphoglycerate-dependent phosphoglycerate mutase